MTNMSKFMPKSADKYRFKGQRSARRISELVTESELCDHPPLVFQDKRHANKIEGSKVTAQSWRMKERVILV